MIGEISGSLNCIQSSSSARRVAIWSKSTGLRKNLTCPSLLRHVTLNRIVTSLVANGSSEVVAAAGVDPEVLINSDTVLSGNNDTNHARPEDDVVPCIARYRVVAPPELVWSPPSAKRRSSWAGAEKLGLSGTVSRLMSVASAGNSTCATMSVQGGVYG